MNRPTDGRRAGGKPAAPITPPPRRAPAAPSPKRSAPNPTRSAAKSPTRSAPNPTRSAANPPPRRAPAAPPNKGSAPTPTRSAVKRPRPAKKKTVRISPRYLDFLSGAGAPTHRRGEKERRFRIEVRRDSVRKPFPFAAIFCLLAIVAVAMYVLSLRIAVDNHTASISRMESEIAASKEEQNSLQVRLNAKYDLTEIERVATEEYGMINRDTLIKRYVTVSGGDEIELIDDDNKTSDSSLLSALASAVQSYLE